MISIISIFYIILYLSSCDAKCIHKYFGHSSFVCVCNLTYCDELQPIDKPENGEYIMVTSSLIDKRWHIERRNVDKVSSEISDLKTYYKIVVNESFDGQIIFGFGGAFTDAAGINLYSIPDVLSHYVLESYFGNNGLEYTLGRVPIAGTDFSTHPYSYNDLKPGRLDPKLKYFKLAVEDYHFKIPYIKKAMKISEKSGRKLELFASPWSSPAWMKTNGKINGKGKLKKKYYKSWASYIVKFLKAYRKQGFEFFAITAQNEPTAGLYFDYPFNSIGWSPEEQGFWISQFLGPQLEKSGFNTSVYIVDDQRFVVPVWVKRLQEIPGASKYVGGVGVHWYYDAITPNYYLDLTKEYFPDLPILYTEACSGALMPVKKLRVMPGSWERGEDYIQNIIQDLNHWVVGWTDWNLALNMNGGPNWVSNYVDSPILVNKGETEVYKNPMYYALAHVTKILKKGSQRIAHSIEGNQPERVYQTVFRRPDGSYAMVLVNRNKEGTKFILETPTKEFLIEVQPRSMLSMVW